MSGQGPASQVQTQGGTIRPAQSLAGPQTTQNDSTYLHPDYARLNPHYGQDKQDKPPVWSLAAPLPRIVRNGMRPEEEIRPARQEPPKQQAPEGEEQADGQVEKQNINEEREPAATEPPAAHPADNAEAQGQREAQQKTEDNRIYFNYWGKVRHRLRQELAEWLGVTVAMTLGLCAGLSTYTSQTQAGSFGTLAPAWGFAFMIAIYVCGGISGGHLNPSITISMSWFRGFPARRVFTYLFAQLLGAITAGGIAYAIYYDAIVNISTVNGVPHNESPAKQALVTLPKSFITPPTAFFTEFIGSAILMGAIMALGDDSNAPPGAGMQAFIIGILTSVLVLALGFTTGGCFNPVRDFGPRLVTVMAGWGGNPMFTEYWAWWVWGPWVADISGALFGSFIYDAIIFTGGESPINYCPKRVRRAMYLRRRNFWKNLGVRKKKIPDLEEAAKQNE
ncbi:putative aquaglyceroporin [Aspergillus stella-maris]|uniref:putative aquaglyceroporin n=1 Tax=Aspergillus stella-maris TaxID=1810926 RepID=UPI003CCD8CDD